MKNGVRDYRRENKLFNSKPEEIRKRSLRNAARQMMEDAGLVHKGDGKDVNHIKPLSKGGSGGRGNLSVQSLHSNRSYRRTSSSAIAA